ncbi:MAG: hypothetical protein AB7N76_25400 [Planctomycetota bacterium]
MLLAVCGCVAEGTDYQALPFVRIDRTDPGVTRVDVPLGLLTVDTCPSAEEEEVVKEQPVAPRGELPPSRVQARDYLVRFPWPFGRWLRRGSHRSWTLTAFLEAEPPIGSPGPAGRAVAGSNVAKNPYPAFAKDPKDGGFLSIPFIFSDVITDHEDHPDREAGPDIDHDIHLWPFFAFGRGSKSEDDYFALLPFGGRTRGLLGKEQIDWIGFPWPVWAKVRDRSYASTHVLFPLVNWIDGPRDRGWRVLPFFGHYEHDGLKGERISERTYVLWPFLNWSTSGLNEETPTETFFFLPFFGRMRGNKQGSLTFLWPLFKYSEWEDEQGRESWELRAPFPVFQVGAGPGAYKFDIWPLFGIRERPGFLRHFVLWPIWRHEDYQTGGKHFSGQWLLPLFWQTRWDRPRGEDEHKLRVFPFLHYRSWRDGSLDVGGLNPWWWDDPGWARTLGHLFTLYRYRRDAEGGAEHDALLGLVGYRDRPAAGRRLDYSRLSLLFGMVQLRSLGEEKGLRLLWLLPELTWGGDS